MLLYTIFIVLLQIKCHYFQAYLSKITILQVTFGQIATFFGISTKYILILAFLWLLTVHLYSLLEAILYY